MKALYLDCPMGLAGDMTLAALIDAGASEQTVRDAVDSLPLDGVTLEITTELKNGFRCRHVTAKAPKQHVHRGLSDCLAIVDGGSLTPEACDIAHRLFRAVAIAEAKVHGVTVEEVHFHEVGAIDSIVDIVGVAVAFADLAPSVVSCGHVPVGRGSVTIAHGVCSLPAPATAELLIGIPLAPSPVAAELTTPTGAAIVRELVDRFEPLPPMRIESIGYGSGTRSFADHPNMLRAFVGQLVQKAGTETITLLETNLDDVTGEVIGHTRSLLLAAGALDVYSIPIDMKKDRPGTCLSVLCRDADREACETILFDETGTLGIRRSVLERRTRSRHAVTVETPFGTIAGKVADRTGSGTDFTPEFESCREAAVRHGVPLRDVYRAASAAAEVEPPRVVGLGDSGHSHDHSHSRSHGGHSHDHSHDGGHSHGHDHG